MGKQVSTLKMTGSYGDAVGYIDKQGRVQMRTKAEKFTDANTKKQREVRVRFLAVSTLAQGMKNVLLGLAPRAKAKRITLRNTFVKYNYGATEGTVMDTGAEAETDFSLVRLSMGSIENCSYGTPDASEPLSIKVAISNTTSDPEANSDNSFVYIVAYNPVANKAVMTKDVLDPRTITLTVPASWNGENVHVYGFVQTFDSANAREEYTSIFNDPTMQGGQAKSDIFQLQSSANYSDSKYLGQVNIS